MKRIILLLFAVGSAWAQIGGDNGGGSGSGNCILSGTQTSGYVLTATDNNTACAWQTVGGASVSADTIKNAWYIADGGSANAITGNTTTSYPGSYSAGQAIIVKMANSNSGATTINVNSLGAKAVTKNGATALASGNLVSGQAYLMVYDGTQFEVANFTILSADVPTLNQNTSGNAATATALAANPGNCAAGTLPRGVDAGGVAENCAKVDLTSEVTGVLPNANTTGTSANTASALIARDASGNFLAGTHNKITLTAPATGATLTLIDGKTFTANNTLSLSGTDSSTLNIGGGGTLGTNAFNSTSYLPLAGGTLTGNLLFSTDNTLDIGATGATRPRDMFLGRNLTIGGTLTTVGGFGIGATPPSVTCGTGGCFALNIGTVPGTCAASGVACLYADSTNRLFASLNNGSYLALVQGPASSTSADIACWNATDGGLLSDCTPSILKLSTFSSANLATQLTDESGTGVVCFTVSCIMTTPNIGVATATSLNGLTVTTSTGTLTIPNGVVLTGPSSSATVATLGLTNTLTGRQDASSAASTAPMKTGTSLPVTCIVGDLYFKSDATAGQNIYECPVTNTWTQQLNSGGGGVGCVPSGSAGQVITDNGATGCTSNPGLTYSAGLETLGVSGSVVGSIKLNNATSGSITLTPTTGALGTITTTIPAVSGTMLVAATSTNTAQALFATGTAGAPAYRALTGGDVPCTTPYNSFSSVGGVAFCNASFPVVKSLNQDPGAGGSTVDMYTVPANRSFMLNGCQATSIGTAATVTLEIKHSGAYTDIAVATPTGSFAGNGTFEIAYVISAADGLSAKVTGTSGQNANVMCNGTEFDAPGATDPQITTQFTTSITNGNNTVFTCPSGRTCTVLTKFATLGSNSQAGAVYYYNATGGSRAIFLNCVPSGGSAGNTNRLSASVTGIGSPAHTSVIGRCQMAANDFLSLNVDSSSASQVAWVTALQK